MEQDSEKLEKIRARMYKPTTDSDLMYMLGNRVTIITYDQIKNYETLDQLLQPYQTVIILYPAPSKDEDKPTKQGHWCCLFVIPGTNILEYFDPYGTFVDDNVKLFNEYDQGVLHGRRPMEPDLINLILESKYADSVHWNDTQFQSTRINTAVCGLWCVVRIKNNNLTEEEFERQFLDYPEKMGILPDIAVAATICNAFPEMA